MSWLSILETVVTILVAAGGAIGIVWFTAWQIFGEKRTAQKNRIEDELRQLLELEEKKNANLQNELDRMRSKINAVEQRLDELSDQNRQLSELNVKLQKENRDLSQELLASRQENMRLRNKHPAVHSQD